MRDQAYSCTLCVVFPVVPSTTTYATNCDTVPAAVVGGEKRAREVRNIQAASRPSRAPSAGAPKPEATRMKYWAAEGQNTESCGGINR